MPGGKAKALELENPIHASIQECRAMRPMNFASNALPLVSSEISHLRTGLTYRRAGTRFSKGLAA